MVWSWTPDGKVSRCSARVPSQASPAASSARASSPSQSFSTEPRLSGRIGTAVTDIGIPQKKTGADAVSPPVPEAKPRLAYLCRCSAAAVALSPLALELASPADRRGPLAGALLRRLFVMTPELHLAIDALALQLLLQGAQRLVDIVIADDDLHKCSPLFLF